MSDNFGQTWKSIRSNIPASAVNVIKEDSENEHILYVGTDNGLYVSFNNGNSWNAFSNGLPNVAVHDLVIQEREKDLVVGTHGRSIYKTNIAQLQDFDLASKKQVHLFNIKSIRSSSRWGSSWSQWSEPNTPTVAISLFSNAAKKLTISIFADAVLVNSYEVNADKGFNTSIFDVSFTKKGRKSYEKEHPKTTLKAGQNGVFYLPKGKYTVKIGNEKQTLVIR